jgi:hypothetical protein
MSYQYKFSKPKNATNEVDGSDLKYNTFEFTSCIMLLEPRLQEYVTKKIFYKKNNINMEYSLENEYHITRDDLELIRRTFTCAKKNERHANSNSNYEKCGVKNVNVKLSSRKPTRLDVSCNPVTDQRDWKQVSDVKPMKFIDDNDFSKFSIMNNYPDPLIPVITLGNSRQSATSTNNIDAANYLRPTKAGQCNNAYVTSQPGAANTPFDFKDSNYRDMPKRAQQETRECLSESVQYVNAPLKYSNAYPSSKVSRVELPCDRALQTNDRFSSTKSGIVHPQQNVFMPNSGTFVVENFKPMKKEETSDKPVRCVKPYQFSSNPCLVQHDPRYCSNANMPDKHDFQKNLNENNFDLCTKRVVPNIKNNHCYTDQYLNTAFYKAIPFMGNGAGIGDMDIASSLRNSEATRTSRQKKEGDSMLDRFDYLDRDFQDPTHIVMDGPRGGCDSRQTDKMVRRNSYKII